MALPNDQATDDQLVHVMAQQADEPLVPLCPYCDEPLDGETVNGLHLDCNRELNQEMEAAWPEDRIIIE